VTRFRAWSLEKASATPEELVEELRLIQIQHSLRPADRCIVFLGAAFTESGASTASQVTVHKRVLSLLAPSAIQQRHLIAAVEWFCGRKYPSLTRFFPLFLKALYEEDVVEEEIFFNWATDYARNEFSAPDSMIDIDTLEAMKASAAPFITWLQEAEEEGEDGDDDDEDEEEEEEDDA
jgi:translation initiation factor 5